jgi:hypothetical protein
MISVMSLVAATRNRWIVCRGTVVGTCATGKLASMAGLR